MIAYLHNTTHPNIATNKHGTAPTLCEGVCVGAECRQSRLAVAVVAAAQLAARTAGWLSFLATTTI